VSLDRVENVESVSQTLVALLTGIAIERNVLDGLDTTPGDAAPDLIPARAAARRSRVTITVRAGSCPPSAARGSPVRAASIACSPIRSFLRLRPDP